MSSVNSVSADSTQPTRTTSSTSALGQAGGIADKDSFLKLLVAQLRNQDPMKPMEDTQFISQLAQFNVLEQMQEMNKSFKSMMAVEQLSYGSGLIGKNVEALDPITNLSFAGTVTQVKMIGGVAKLTVGNKTVGLEDITKVG